MRQFKHSMSIVFSCLLVAAAVTFTGCSGGGNEVVTGELTAEQEAERDEVTMPGDPGESGGSSESDDN